MRSSHRQGELFSRTTLFGNAYQKLKNIPLSKEFIEAWQSKIYSYQSKIFKGTDFESRQTSLFQKDSKNLIHQFKPLKLTALPLNFWRTANAPHSGQAIYIVMDRLDENNRFIILYIGETISADQRWKGVHDCKSYLDKYCEALQKARISSRLSIRFWTDVPKETQSRRNLEQELIQLWRPPFNKETRSSWQTPFTNEIN